jgi:hypothetical protein
MKRFSFLPSVALVTFVVGVTLNLCASQIHRLWPAEREFARHIQLKLLRLEKVGGRYEMQFHIVNGGSEPLRYRSSAKDDHCAFFLWRPGEDTRQMPCGCGNGLAERTLSPGEATNFRIGLSQGWGDVRLGFDFLVGGERRQEVVWSGMIPLP